MYADGTLITPSFHREYLFGSLDPAANNPNWTNAIGKYLTLRPRPKEHPNFPYPESRYGDVKNLVWAPGGCDSIWIDLGAPVMTAPDGRKYKMLVAPLILDLDGRINVNVHGNVRGQGNAHVSKEGWGPWEVNLAAVLNINPGEVANLFNGKPSPQLLGRYGPLLRPIDTRAGSMAP